MTGAIVHAATVRCAIVNSQVRVRAIQGAVIGGAGGATVTEASAPPANPASGDLWFDIDDGRAYAFYSDVWVEFGTSAGATGATGATGPQGPTGATGAQGPAGDWSSAQTFNNQTNDYTLVLTDAGKIVELNKGTAVTLTVPANASVAFPIGSRVDVAQQGAGQVTVSAAGGVTIRATPGSKLRAQYSGATLVKRATDEWFLFGDLSA